MTVTAAEIETTAKTWLQKYERIVIVFLALATGGWLGNEYLVKSAANDNAKVVLAQQQLAEQTAKDQAQAAQTAQTAAQYQALIQTLTQQNAQLAQAQAGRTIVLQQQQAADKTLPPPALAARWASLIGVQPSEITATPAGITVDPDAALATVETVEQVPVLKANLADETTQYNNSQAELAKANELVADQGTEITGLNTQLVDQKKADDAALAAEKSSSRKKSRNWFLRGLAVGGATVATLLLHGV